MSSPQLASPDPFTEEELDGVEKLRERLGKLHGLPADLCTDFGLARYWRAARGDCAEAEQRLRDLAAHMRAFGMHRLEQNPELGVGQRITRNVFERFAISELDPPAGDVFSGDLLVFLQRMNGVDIKQILRVVPLGHILEAYTQLQLNWMRAIVDHERRTGRPAAAVAIIDLHGLPLRDFMNPLAPASRMARLIVRIWSEYFTENLVRIYLVNPPGLLSLLWQVARHIMDQRTWCKLVVVPKGSDLLAHLAADSVPEAYGGTRRDQSGYSACPSTCVSAPRPVRCPQDLFPGPEHWWTAQVSSGKKMPKWKTANLASKKGKEAHESEPIECNVGDRLLWMCTSTGDLQFELICRPKGRAEEEEEVPIWPKSTVCSLAVPEHGAVECRVAGEYVARFCGPPNASWLMGALGQGTKVNYFVHKEAKLTMNGAGGGGGIDEDGNGMKWKKNGGGKEANC